MGVCVWLREEKKCKRGGREKKEMLGMLGEKEKEPEMDWGKQENRERIKEEKEI